MENPPPTRRQRGDLNKSDRLSSLPDDLLITILSLLPTCVSARTSVLCRRFRHLWKASPAIDLTFILADSRFEAMANCALLCRDSSNPLLSLRLIFRSGWNRLPDSFWCSLLVKAHSLGLRHLSLERQNSFEDILPTVFSIDSLQSLQLLDAPLGDILPSVVTFTRLKSLSFILHDEANSQISRLLSQLPFLEDLVVEVYIKEVFALSSKSIRNLDLTIYDYKQKAEYVGLYIPSLEMLRLRTQDNQNLPLIEGTMSSLRKAIIILHRCHKGDASAVAQLLNCVSSVEELSLDVEESWVRSSIHLFFYLVHVLVSNIVVNL